MSKSTEKKSCFSTSREVFIMYLLALQAKNLFFDLAWLFWPSRLARPMGRFRPNQAWAMLQGGHWRSCWELIRLHPINVWCKCMKNDYFSSQAGLMSAKCLNRSLSINRINHDQAQDQHWDICGDHPVPVIEAWECTGMVAGGTR